MNIKKEIENYQPVNEEELADKQIILKFIEDYPDIFYRENRIAHITSSAWVTNKDHTKILMAYHNIYNSFSWLGGHNDGQQDCLSVAIKEVREESGIENVEPISKEIFSLEVLSVDGHYKRGKYVSTHLHLNITYLLCADDNEELKIKEDENSAVKWFEIDKAIEASNEVWFREHIYSKLNRKLKEYYENN